MKTVGPARDLQVSSQLRFASGATNVARLILAAIVIAYLSFAMLWVVRTPAFAPPDELAHADYMFAFFDAGKFYRVQAGSSANDVLSETRFLEAASGYRRIHYNELGRVPAGYGSVGFFRQLVANAPAATGVAKTRGSVMPYVMFAYPATYYLIVAGVANALTLADPHAVVQTFFIARACSVLFGAGTLLLAFATFRNRRFPASTALLGVTGIAMLPLFCWVSSYVQPDNLVIFLVAIAMWSVSRRPPSLTWLCVAVCSLCLVKVHYGLALWVPALIFAVGNARKVELVKTLLLFGVLPLLATGIAFQLTPVTGGLSTVSHAAGGIDLAAVGSTAFAELAKSVIASVYLGGAVFTNYWLGYGTHGFFFTKPETSTLAAAILALTVPLLIACFVWYVRRACRIIRIGMTRRLRTALRLFASGFAVNFYVSYTMLLLAAGTLGRHPLALEARYWLPLIVPTTVIVVGELPRALPARGRRFGMLALASAIALLAVTLNATTPWVIQRDYYTPATGVPRYDFGGVVVNDTGTEAFHAREVRVRDKDSVTIRGFALDMGTGLPPDRVSILSDGRFVAVAKRVRWDADAAAQWHDDVLESAGFEARLEAKAFGLGRHDLSIVAWRRGAPSRPLQHHVLLDVRS